MSDLKKKKNRPNTKDIQALLAFLPALEKEGFVPATWVSAPGMLPFSVPAPEVGDLVHELYERGFIYSFDWPEWNEAYDYFNDPTKLADADLDTLQSLFTVIVRSDRFSDGTVASMVKNGFIAQILRRLAALAQSKK